MIGGVISGVIRPPVRGLNRNKGVPALAWRFADNRPVRRAEGGYWLRGS